MKNLFKKICFSKLLLASIFSIALFYMNKIHFFEYVFENNYLEKYLFSEFLVLLILIPVNYILLGFIEKYYKVLTNNLIVNNEYINKKKFCLIAFIFLLLIYGVYYFSFYPGGVYIDTWSSYGYLTGEQSFSNHQPVLYTLSLNLVKAFGDNLEAGFAVYTALQVIIMVTCLTYFIYWLLKKNVNPKAVAFITILLGTFKLFPLYSVSIWKDTPFSLALFLNILVIIDLIIDIQNNDIRIKNIIKYSITSLLVLFLRNNGLFISLGITCIGLITLLICKIQKIKIKRLLTLNIISIILVLFFLIMNQLYPYMGISTDSSLEESLGIPIQQIARVVVVDGNITNEQKELIEKIIPIDVIKEKYLALLVDPIKWDENFNAEYLKENIDLYAKLWFELLIQNPGEYINAYLLQTSGFWTFNVKGPEAYHSAVKWETIPEITQIDLIEENFNHSVKDDLLTIPYYSGGLFFWITILSMYLTYKLANKRFLIAYIPAIILWGTIMISTPMGSALRYVYILVLMLPLNIVYPMIASKYEEVKCQKQLNCVNK